MNPDKLALRKIAVEDWLAVHAWAQLPEACRYQAWGPNTEAETKAFVEAAVDAWSEVPLWRYGYVAVVDGDVVGSGVLKVQNAVHRQGELSYITHPEVWGRGLGTAIGRELLRIGFEDLGLHRIVGTCDPRNRASARILAKIGMTHEGRLRHTTLLRDGWRDSETYSILEDEWRARPADGTSPA